MEEPRVEEPRVQETRQEERSYAPPPPPPPAPAPRVEIPQIEPGLVMIETDRAKAPAAQPAEEEPQHLGRPRRERPKPLSQEEELKQVETKR